MKKLALRQCVGCDQQKDKREMLRIIRDAEGQFAVDVTGKLNGRGAYICNDRECAAKCVARKGLDRSFKEKISKDIYDLLLGFFENAEEVGASKEVE